jgi:hypothetical protein
VSAARVVANKNPQKIASSTDVAFIHNLLSIRI